MFQSAYQDGDCVEVFSPAGKDPAAKWMLAGKVGRMYDKGVKGFVLAVSGGASSKMQIPKARNGALALRQRHLVIQVMTAASHDVPFAIELGVTDASGTKRRLVLSSSFRTLHCTPLHAQIPLAGLEERRGSWSNLCVDLAGLTSTCFKADAFRSLDMLSVGPTCRVRKIFTMRGALDQPYAQEEAKLFSGVGAFAGVDNTLVEPLPLRMAFPGGVKPPPKNWVISPSTLREHANRHGSPSARDGEMAPPSRSNASLTSVQRGAGLPSPPHSRRPAAACAAMTNVTPDCITTPPPPRSAGHRPRSGTSASSGSRNAGPIPSPGRTLNSWSPARVTPRSARSRSSLPSSASRLSYLGSTPNCPDVVQSPSGRETGSKSGGGTAIGSDAIAGTSDGDAVSPQQSISVRTLFLARKAALSPSGSVRANYTKHHEYSNAGDGGSESDLPARRRAIAAASHAAVADPWWNSSTLARNSLHEGLHDFSCHDAQPSQRNTSTSETEAPGEVEALQCLLEINGADAYASSDSSTRTSAGPKIAFIEDASCDEQNGIIGAEASPYGEAGSARVVQDVLAEAAPAWSFEHRPNYTQSMDGIFDNNGAAPRSEPNLDRDRGCSTAAVPASTPGSDIRISSKLTHAQKSPFLAQARVSPYSRKISSDALTPAADTATTSVVLDSTVYSSTTLGTERRESVEEKSEPVKVWDTGESMVVVQQALLHSPQAATTRRRVQVAAKQEGACVDTVSKSALFSCPVPTSGALASRGERDDEHRSQQEEQVTPINRVSTLTSLLMTSQSAAGVVGNKHSHARTRSGSTSRTAGGRGDMTTLYARQRGEDHRRLLGTMISSARDGADSGLPDTEMENCRDHGADALDALVLNTESVNLGAVSSGETAFLEASERKCVISEANHVKDEHRMHSLPSNECEARHGNSRDSFIDERINAEDPIRVDGRNHHGENDPSLTTSTRLRPAEPLPLRKDQRSAMVTAAKKRASDGTATFSTSAVRLESMHSAVQPFEMATVKANRSRLKSGQQPTVLQRETDSESVDENDADNVMSSPIVSSQGERWGKHEAEGEELALALNPFVKDDGRGKGSKWQGQREDRMRSGEQTARRSQHRNDREELARKELALEVLEDSYQTEFGSIHLSQYPPTSGVIVPLPRRNPNSSPPAMEPATISDDQVQDPAAKAHQFDVPTVQRRRVLARKHSPPIESGIGFSDGREDDIDCVLFESTSDEEQIARRPVRGLSPHHCYRQSINGEEREQGALGVKYDGNMTQEERNFASDALGRSGENLYFDPFLNCYYDKVADKYYGLT